MQSASPDGSEQVTGSGARRPILWPWLFSLALHGVLAAFAMQVMFAPAQARVALERPSISVALALRPRAPVEPPAPAPAEAPRPDEAQEPAAAERAEPVPEAARAEATPAAEAPQAGASAAPSAPAWTPATIRAAIQNDAATRRSAITESWVTGCILERRRRGTRDCDEHRAEPESASLGMRAGRAAATATFDAALRGARDGRRVAGFLERNEALQPLMEQGGLLATLASQRYYIHREYIWYLTGNGPDPVFAAMGGFHADVLGGPRLQVPGGTAFICREGPCVYKYTGFSIVRPERAPEANAFRVVPLPLGSQR